MTPRNAQSATATAAEATVQDGSTTVKARSVYLARHGQTESNVAGLYAGRKPEPLTGRGRAQVGRLADTLVGFGIAQIWTSSVSRALESAQLIGRRLGVRVRVEERLDEMRLGPWEGRTEEQVAREYPDVYALWLTQPDKVRLEGRETLAQVALRVMAVVEEARWAPEPVLLMSHVAPIRVAVLSSLGLSLGAYKRLAIGNAACVRLDGAAQQATRVPQGGSVQAEIEQVGSAAA